MGGPVAVSAKTAEEVKQVGKEMGRLRDALAENESIVDMVEVKLSAVLMGKPSEDAGVPEAPEEVVCELAGQLRNLRRNVCEQTAKINRMLNRLEL